MPKLFQLLVRPPMVARQGPHAHQALILHNVLLIIGIATLLIATVMVPLFATNKLGSWMALGLLFAVTCVARILLERGHMRLASVVTVAFAWVCAIGFVFLSGGTTSAGTVYLLTASAMSGILLGERGVLFFSTASVLGSLLIAQFDQLNLNLPTVYKMTPMLGWTALAFCLVVTTLLVYYAIRNHALALNVAHEQITARQHAEIELRRLATVDELTGLYNRRNFFERANQLFEIAKHDRLALAILMIDADHFKLVNDTWGHAAGDSVLVQTARILAASVRGQDVLARYGGEEFVMFSLGVRAEDALHLAERVRAQVAAHVYQAGAQTIGLTLSIGIATCDLSQHATTLDHLLSRADQALYCAKERGRNCCVLDQA